MTEREENPIASGLIALAAVAVVVGLLAGIAALAGTRLLGIGGDGSGSSGGAGAGDSLYLPDPVPTTQQSGPLVTLPATEATETATVTESETVSETPTDEEPEITLTAGARDVGPGEELRLSGLYAEGEGAVLDIFYNVNDGGWEEFPLDTNVSGGIFQVDVQTWKEGTIKWRVEDATKHLASNAMTVHHG